MQRLNTALQIHFALLSALGGLMLGIGNTHTPLPVIAVAASLFSLFAVDLLKLFALPPLAAYLGMAGVAVYCISDFVLVTPQDNQQLVAVAQLLVLVLAVLQMQRKTRRVFEQIGIFCLLELVVAAVFNNALTFAAMMVPFAALGMSALVLLQTAAVAETAAGGSGEEASPAGRGFGTAAASTSKAARAVRTQASAAAAAISTQGLRLPRLSLTTLSPSIVLVAAIFFYALPRTMQSAAMNGSGGGMAMVGYSETLNLKQMGRMLQNPAPVMRVRLIDRKTRAVYPAQSPLYLRGAVLDSYELGGSSGVWRSLQIGRNRRNHRLPSEPAPDGASDRLFYDSVEVEVTAQPLSTVSLFAIAPYYATEHDAELFHTVGNWTLSRGDSTTEFDKRRVTYRFGTNAFYAGKATRYLRALGPHESVYLLPDVVSTRADARQPFWIRRLTRFDGELMPTVQEVADRLVAASPASARHPHAICLRFEEYLQREANLRYTLDLTHDRQEGMDPVEQFLSVDRAGHCQFFASTLVMMLRSQGIPARLVVGYKSGEYNALGQQFVVRQSHAHAWAEALLEADDLPPGTHLYGQPKHGPVWLRLDPTPRDNWDTRADAAAGAAQLVDFAQTLWERYVLDMDSKQQQSSLFGTMGLNRLANAYSQQVAWARHWAMQMGADLVSGKPSAQRRFAMATATALLLGAAVALVVWMRRGGPRFGRAHVLGSGNAAVGQHPQIDFFAETYDQLARIGLLRQPGQTPQEFAAVAARRLSHPSLPTVDPPLQFLTNTYYRVRFGASPRGAAAEDRIQRAIAQLTRAVDLVSAERADGR